MPGEELGRECYTYYNSATHASPTWVLIANAVDVSTTIDKNYGDVSSRASGWKKNKAGLKDLGLSFGYRYKAGVTDSVFDVLRANAIANTPTELFMADGLAATTGTEGIRAYMDMSLGREEPLEDGVLTPFECKHVLYYEAGAVVDPDWYTTS